MNIPEFKGHLRKNIIRVPECIEQCSGIRVLGKKIKSLIFSTDVAIIRNHNADAIIAVYPFTPQPAITQAILTAADVPVFCGVGGGITSGERSVAVALHAEFQGAMGVVLNTPASNELITRIKKRLEIPVIVTVVSLDEDFEARIRAKVDFFNVSGAEHTPGIVKLIRRISEEVGIIATGGKTERDILRTIAAGADAISYTPPSAGELLRENMERFRKGDTH